ncbi:MAG: oxidoreductase [Planctomycetes bacterium RBG_16_64_12]|nr:MAG: oxidoreductase [Planctomycetes bacterium RBG_16_64_12]
MMTNKENAKVALVTGAGKRRVGNVIARMLAARGYQIALHYRRSAEAAEETVREIQSQGVRARAFQADVSRGAEVDRLFRETLDHFGRLDVLVTAAAVWEPKPLEEVTEDDVRRQFEINALGTFLCCRKAGLIMVKQPEGGAIVTIGDWAVARPYPGYSAYFPSKGAIPAITRTMAVELARRNPAVRVNCILPGPVMLPDDLSQEDRDQAIAGTLVRREGRPEHVGHAVVFLVENDFVTGVCLPVDGGRTIADGRGDQRDVP